MHSILSKYLPAFDLEAFNELLCESDGYSIVYRDRLIAAIEDRMDESDRGQYERTVKLVEDIINDCKQSGVIVLESWGIKIERETCIGCPAYQWVIHRNGTHPCRLGFNIEEQEDTAKPLTPCIRPMTVGMSYQIAKELNRPEPIVGKLDAWQYEQYEAKKKALEC